MAGQHADATKDRERDAWFASEGLRTVRFWNSDILANPQAVLERLINVLSENSQATEVIS